MVSLSLLCLLVVLLGIALARLINSPIKKLENLLTEQNKIQLEILREKLEIQKHTLLEKHKELQLKELNEEIEKVTKVLIQELEKRH